MCAVYVRGCGVQLQVKWSEMFDALPHHIIFHLLFHARSGKHFSLLLVFLKYCFSGVELGDNSLESLLVLS